jgi:integrase
LTLPTVEGRRFFDLERLAEFWRSVAGADAGGGTRYPVALQLLRLLTLTAARTLEIRALQWADVIGLDSPSPSLSIPAARMKRRKAWSVPLSPAAAEVLREVRAWQLEAGAGLKGVKEGRVFVHLTGNYKGRCLSENAVNDLLQGMGWGDVLTAHGLRKVFSTLAHGAWPYNGPNRALAIEYSLAHVSVDKVRATYDKNDYLDLRSDLMGWWAGHLQASITVEAAPVARLRRVK